MVIAAIVSPVPPNRPEGWQLLQGLLQRHPHLWLNLFPAHLPIEAELLQTSSSVGRPLHPSWEAWLSQPCHMCAGANSPVHQSPAPLSPPHVQPAHHAERAAPWTQRGKRMFYPSLICYLPSFLSHLPSTEDFSVCRWSSLLQSAPCSATHL